MSLRNRKRGTLFDGSGKDLPHNEPEPIIQEDIKQENSVKNERIIDEAIELVEREPSFFKNLDSLLPQDYKNYFTKIYDQLPPLHLSKDLGVKLGYVTVAVVLLYAASSVASADAALTLQNSTDDLLCYTNRGFVCQPFYIEDMDSNNTSTLILKGAISRNGDACVTLNDALEMLTRVINSSLHSYPMNNSSSLELCKFTTNTRIVSEDSILCCCCKTIYERFRIMGLSADDCDLFTGLAATAAANCFFK